MADATESIEWDDFLPKVDGDLPSLRIFDDLCRCRICREYFGAPVMTQCGHTFCSLCIRRALAADQRCPVCRSLEEESKLRKNTMIEEIVDAYVPLRQDIVKYVHRWPAKRARRIEEPAASQESNSSQTAVRRSSRRANRQSAPMEIEEEIDAPATTPEPAPIPEGHVQCPICQGVVKATSINQHLDAGCATSPSTARVDSRHFAPKAESVARPPPPQSARIPKLTYSVLTEAKLRAALKELGLSPLGNKAQLQRRHLEWVHLWNSNIDAKEPKSKKVLLADLAAWDRAQARPAQAKLTEEDVEEIRQSNDTFTDLIAAAKASARKKREQQAEEQEQEQEQQQESASKKAKLET